MLFRLGTPVLVIVIVVIVVGTTLGGVALGRRLESAHDAIREPVGVVQAALLGFVGLLLAFGLTMAVGRYESRRGALVVEANAIGTAFLRSETIGEPQRSESITLLRTYVDGRIRLAHLVVETSAFGSEVDASKELERALWKLAGQALVASPDGTAVRLYVDSLNTMFDAGSSREAAYHDRIPLSVAYLQIGGSALALGVLGLYLATLGRRVLSAMLASVLVALILLVALDLDRPQRGLITVPSRALASLQQSMQQEPASAAP